MTLEDFDSKPSTVPPWVFPSRTLEKKTYTVTQRTDGSYDCYDNDGNMCWGDIAAKKAGSGRCRHVAGVLKALGDPVPKEEAKIQERIEKAVKMVKAPIRTTTKIDPEGLKRRKMAATSLAVWHDALFQDELGAKQGKVLRYIMDHPESTDREIANGLKWPINTVTPRRGELEGMLIEQVGVKKSEDTNRPAMTWRATKFAMEMVE
jgi:hypothetical protein